MFKGIVHSIFLGKILYAPSAWAVVTLVWIIWAV